LSQLSFVATVHAWRRVLQFTASSRFRKRFSVQLALQASRINVFHTLALREARLRSVCRGAGSMVIDNSRMNDQQQWR
jgi:hypothetical protein